MLRTRCNLYHLLFNTRLRKKLYISQCRNTDIVTPEPTKILKDIEELREELMEETYYPEVYIGEDGKQYYEDGAPYEDDENCK